MQSARLLRLIAMTAAALVLSAAAPLFDRDLPGKGGTVRAQNSVELDEFLFVQDPKFGDGKGGIHVLWLPAPLVKYCLGKTAQQCANIDYCIRTTNRDSSQCKNLGVVLSRIPPYPAGIRPARQLSVVYFPLAPIKGMDLLKTLYAGAPKASLERLSMSARIKARIKFTRKSDDDEFEVVEFLPTPPF
jgi:hypothetical protein